jgi:hypothetical protein
MSAEPVGTMLLFENDRVRVWEMTLAPGQTCAPHRHMHDYLMLYPAPARMASGQEGQEVIQYLEAGMVAYRTVGAAGLEPHAISNAGQGGSTHFIVELLGPSSAATSRPPEHNGRGTLLAAPGQQ